MDYLEMSMQLSTISNNDVPLINYPLSHGMGITILEMHLPIDVIITSSG